MSSSVTPPTANPVSVNAQVAPLVASLIADADRLRIQCHPQANGSLLIDAGIHCVGGLAAGQRVAAICMANLADISLRANPNFAQWPWQIEVATSQPVLACLASQYAGWSLSCDDPDRPGKTFHALGSGPARAIAQREELFTELAYRDDPQATCLVLETDRFPPQPLVEKIVQDCGVKPEQLTLILTPTGSLAGVVQIAARVIEVGLHKAHELGYPLHNIVDALGSTPIPPPVKDGLVAMGRTNDSILLGGQIHLFVQGADADAEQLAQQLPSSTSSDYGKPFAKIFADYEYDFFKIDGALFSPAKIAVTAVESGRTFHAGKLDEALLNKAFNGSA